MCTLTVTHVHTNPINSTNTAKHRLSSPLRLRLQMAPLPLRLRPPVRLGRDPPPPLRLLCTVKPLARDLRRGIAAGPAHRLLPPLPLHLLHEDRVELVKPLVAVTPRI